MHLLTLPQKKQIFDEYQRRKKNAGNATQAALAGWAKVAFRLDCVPNQSTISRIIKNDPALSCHDTNLPINAKRNRKASAPRLDKALYTWPCELNNNGVLLNGEILKMKAEVLQDQANLHLPTDEKLAM